MQMKLNGSGVGALAGIAIGAWALWKYRPWAAITNTVDAAAAAIQNTLDGDSNGQLDFVESWLGGQANVKNLPELQKLYEIDTSKDTISKAFIGSKPFAIPFDQVKPMQAQRGVYAAPLPTPLGLITASGGPFWTTDAGRREAGKLDSQGKYTLAYNGNENGRTIKGDPRALYCLDALIKRSGLQRIDHVGLNVLKNDMSKDFGHRRGHAIDLTNDTQMNKLLEAAKSLGMPLAWISRFKAINPLSGKMEWPTYILRDGLKVHMSYTSINHDSHYHLILPRPNKALGYWYGSPFQSGSWNPSHSAPPGGAGGDSSDWNDNPANTGNNPPPIAGV